MRGNLRCLEIFPYVLTMQSGHKRKRGYIQTCGAKCATSAYYTSMVLPDETKGTYSQYCSKYSQRNSMFLNAINTQGYVPCWILFLLFISSSPAEIC